MPATTSKYGAASSLMASMMFLASPSPNRSATLATSLCSYTSSRKNPLAKMTNTILPNRYCCGLVMYLGKVGTLATLTCRRPNACAANPMASPTPPMVIHVWLSARRTDGGQQQCRVHKPETRPDAALRKATPKELVNALCLSRPSPSHTPPLFGPRSDRAASAPPHRPAASQRRV